MMFSIGFGYATSYLQNLDIADGTIGAAISLFSLAGAFFQFLLGRIADKSRRWNFRNLLILLSIIQLTASLLLPFISSYSLAGTILFGCILITTYSMLPLLSSVSFFYSSQNFKVDFGIARGIGSTAYGVISIIMGKAVTTWGTACIPFFAAGVSLALLIEALLLPSPAKYKIAEKIEKNGQSSKKKEKALILRYPAFTLMLLGMTIVMVFQNMNVTYFVRIIEKVGGNSTSLGISLGITAVMEIPSLFFYSRLNKRISSKNLLLISCTVFTLKALLFCLAGSVTAIYLIQVLSIGAFGLMAAAKVYYAHDTFDEKDIVTGQALVAMTEAIGMVLGSLFGGLIIKTGGIKAVLWGGFAISLAGTILSAFGALLRKKN